MSSGESINCIVRVKPNSSYQRENVKVMGQSLSILDNNNRIVEEFQSTKIYNQDFSIQQVFDNEVYQFLSPLVQGFNVSIFTTGQMNSGKTYTLSESRAEEGLVFLCFENIFNLLQNKKHQANQNYNGSYSFQIEARYVELYEEECYDLFNENMNGYNMCNMVNDDNEDVKIEDARWIQLNSIQSFKQQFQEGKLKRQNNYKTSAMLTI